MIVKVVTIGAGRKALVLDSQSLEELGATEIEEFDVSRRGEVIELRPVTSSRHADVRSLAERLMSQHDETFRKLSQ